MYHYYLLVSTADRITARFTSQTSPRKSSGYFTSLLTYSRLHYYRLVFADIDLKSLLTGSDISTNTKNIATVKAVELSRLHPRPERRGFSLLEDTKRSRCNSFASTANLNNLCVTI